MSESQEAESQGPGPQPLKGPDATLISSPAGEVPTQSSLNPQEATSAGEAKVPGPESPVVDVGSQLGPYKLVDKLGEGGMGAVYKARHVKLGKLVALKILPQHVLSRTDALARFEREMMAVGSLHHPNIVQAHDAGEIGGVHYLSMEYVEGDDLQALVKSRGPLSVIEACQTIQQAAQGLAAAHKLGLVHRDIKPSNLFVTKETGQIKILDMGLALLSQEEIPAALTSTGQCFGTPDYMAPEQWNDAHSCDARADLYSLGCTLFYLLVGQPPYHVATHRTAANKMKGHVLDPIPDLQQARPDVPAGVVAIYQRLMAKQPQDRFASAEEVAVALAPFATPATNSGSTLDAPSKTNVAPLGTVTQPSDPTATWKPESQETLPVAGGGVRPPGTGRQRRLLAFGAAMVLLGVIIITITSKDGTKTKIEVPDTSKVEITTDASRSTKTNGWHGWPADAPKPAIAPFDADQAKEHQEAWAKYLNVPVEYTNTIGMKFRLIPPGEFLMGSSPKEIEVPLKVVEATAASADVVQRWKNEVQSEAPRHTVILTQPVYLGIYEVTQKEYQSVMGANPSSFAANGSNGNAGAGFDTSNRPVETVSWNAAAEFCAKLSQQEKLKPFYVRAGDTVTPLLGTGYRLPTEAEWEFSCRAGTATRFWSGENDEDVEQAGWFRTNSGGRTHAVGELKANPFGLFDLHGNVWELVQDRWELTYYEQFQGKPAIDQYNAFLPDSLRVMRGGYYNDPEAGCRATIRAAVPPTAAGYHRGFRASLVVDAVRQALKVTGPAMPKPVATTPAAPTTPKTGWHGWPADAPKPAIAPFSFAQAMAIQEAWAEYLGVPVEYTNSIGMTFRLVPPGEFMMGGPKAELETHTRLGAGDLWNEIFAAAGPQHSVILTQPLYLGVNEVTQQQYQRVTGKNPSAFSKMGARSVYTGMQSTDKYPVDSVSWLDAVEYCNRLGELEQQPLGYSRSGENVVIRAANGYRLPTEAEWEFACRAGTVTMYHFGGDRQMLPEYGWFADNSGDSTEDFLKLAVNPDLEPTYLPRSAQLRCRPHPVGGKRPNPWGFYDLYGNVAEWCQDWYDPHYYQNSPRDNPVGPETGVHRVNRGGFWVNSSCIWSYYRMRDKPKDALDAIGMRLAISVDAVKQAVQQQQVTGWHGWPADAPKPAIAPFDAEQARQHQEAWAAHLKVPVEYTNSIGMKFRLIPPGEFMMGSTAEEITAALKDIGENKQWQEHIQSEAPQHKVILTQPIYLGVNEVTQAEYEKVMGTNPSHFAPTGMGKEAVAGMATTEHPAEMVSWNDATEFSVKLSQQERLKPFYSRAGETITPLDGTGYRLPSEAQWEFACRAGTAKKYWIGDQDEDLVRAGWFGGNAGSRTHVAGELKANPFGLHDMHGNIWEWVQDGWDATYYGQFQEKPGINPSSPFSAGSRRVLRGGDWSFTASNCRSSHRHALDPAHRSHFLGFRVSLTVDAVKTAIAESTTKPAVTTIGWHGWPADAPKPAIAPFDAAQAKKHQEAWAKYLNVPVEYTNTIGMKFRLIPPGEFTMGSTPEEIAAALKDAGENKLWQECVQSEAPQHKVILTQPIYFGVNEVTQAEYEKVMGVNPSHFAPTGMGKEAVAGLETAEHPVETVSWNDVAEFSAKLSQQEQLKPFYFRAGETIGPLDGTGYRLPSEAEWEFACRAGTTTKYWIGEKHEDLVRASWFRGNSGRRTHAAGELKANPFGLSDIHGNVWEWVQDGWDATYYGQFQEKPAFNPISPFSAVPLRVFRGGNFDGAASFCQSSHRGAIGPTHRDHGIGFRVSLSIDAVRQGLKVTEPGMPKPSAPARAKTGWHGWPADVPKPAIAPFDAEQARQHQEAWAAHLKVPVEYTNSIGMKFRLIPPGEFMMGSTQEEIAAALKFAGDDKLWQESIHSEAPQHKVVLSQPTYCSIHEVTQAQFEQVMGKNPSRFSVTGEWKDVVAGLETTTHPVEMVSWNDANEFCSKLREKERLERTSSNVGEGGLRSDRTGYRLPTEAEWEFACRAGTTTEYWSGGTDQDLRPVGWFHENSGGRTHAVGELKDNAFGVHDMHGNVWEWVQDAWDPNYYGHTQGKPALDPIKPFLAGSSRMIRGGNWSSYASSCRAASRCPDESSYANTLVGLRVSLPVDAVRQALKVTGPALPKPVAADADGAPPRE